MVKKKTKTKGWGFSSSSQSLHSYLKEFSKYIVKQQWSNAEQKLEELEQRFSLQPEILECWLILADQIKNWKTCQKKAEQFISINPDDPDAYLTLAGICMKNVYPVLAVQALNKFCEKFPNHSRIPEANSKISQLQTIVSQLLKDQGLEEKQGLEIGALLEQSRFLFETGQHTQAHQSLEKLLKLAPNLSPALNNLSIILCQNGDLTEGITLSKKVLEQDPQNIHATANLIRLYILSGQIELAEQSLKQLKELKSEMPDHWSKKAEALSFYGDNSGLIELGQEAESSEMCQDLMGIFWHYVAVAHGNLGQDTKARKLWEQSLKISPDFECARENLENIKLPVGKRNTPWALDLQDWLPSTLIKDLKQMVVSDSENNNKGKSIINKIMKNYPQIVSLIPILLKRGSPLAREFALHICTATKTPELLSALKEFAFSQEGTDQQRFEAIQAINKEGLIPSGPVKIWIKGKQEEILLMGIEINDNPTIPHSKKVRQLGQDAVATLKQGHGEKAESILLQALKLEPSAPDLKFNLAGAYMLQGRGGDANELVRKIHEEHPDYAFATIALAQHHLENNEISEAENLLQPLLYRKQFNYMEFSKFCEIQIKLAMKKKTPETANSWLGIWKEIGDEDNPSLEYWCNRLQKKSSWFIK